MDYEKIYQMVADKELTIEEALILMEKSTESGNKASALAGKEFPLSEGQKALWVIYQLSHENYAYNTPAIFMIPASADFNKLKKSFEKLIELHPALRTVFKIKDGQPVQQVRETGALDYAEVSIAGFAEDEIRNVLLEESRKPFKLEEGPLFRARLYKRNTGGHILLLNFHHIIFDGISSQLFIEDLAALYQAETEDWDTQLSSKGVFYRDFVFWQQDMLESEEGEEHKRFWLSKIGNGDGELDLPFDKPRPSIATYNGRSYALEISREMVDALRILSQGANSTLFTVMLSAFNVLLYRYSNSSEISVGTPVAGRPDLKFERVIGYFMNMIVIRSSLSGAITFDELLRNTQKNVLETFEHSDYPNFTLVKELRQKNKKSGALFNIAFYFQNWLDKPEDESQSRLIIDNYQGIRQEGEFDLTLEVVEGKDGAALYFKYNPDLFEETTIARLGNHYRNILAHISADGQVKISDIELFTSDEKANLILGWNNTSKAYSLEKSVLHLVVEQALRCPESVAVVCGAKSLSYQELSRKSLQLAAYLSSKGIGPGDLMGIYLERSVDLLIALLGIMGSGAGYVPLDPLYPTDRIQMMLEDGKVGAVITESDLANRLPVNIPNLIKYDEEQPEIGQMEEAPTIKTNPESTAYVIFTSGSTGRPKGVEVLHRGLTNFICSMAEEPGFGSNDRLLAVTTVCFDISYLELFLPLCQGGVVEIVPSEITRDGIKLKERIEQGGFTVMQATPATWQMLLKANWNKKLPLKILCGGEALPVELAEKLLELSDEVWNLYGPTETTIWSSICRVNHGQKITIGRPIANTQLYVLDANLRLCPVGAPGELLIGGLGLAKGYFNRPEETMERFIKSPFEEEPSARLYKTGDMVRFLPDGSIEYLGRMDNQVKIRGFRVELDEIETALKRIEGIQEAVVVLRKEGDDRKQLTTFLIAGGGIKDFSAAAFRDLLKNNLPEYMIPSQFIQLTSYPLTLNAKVDRKALSTWKFADLIAKHPATQEPSIGHEKSVVNKETKLAYTSSNQNSWLKLVIRDLQLLVSKILGIDESDIQRDTNLGELGFDSISFTSLGVEINSKYEIGINATLFYEYTTIESLAAYLAKKYPDSLERYYSSRVAGMKADPTYFQEETLKSTPAQIAAPKEGYDTFTPKDNTYDKIAIIGISGRLPGSNDLAEFWNKLKAQEDLVTVIPEERWDYRLFYGDPKENKCLSKWGGFISEVYNFDALFFGLSPREAEIMDPQQRLFLQVAWEAMEDGGYKPSALSGIDVGVFVGCTGTDFMDVVRSSGYDIDAHSISGISRTIIPNRLSYLFNFHGPSAVIDTACSSSLIAVHRAVTSLQSGECSVAIAGGVNLILSPLTHIALGKTDMLSPDGRCKAFDKSANGYVRGEGIAAVLLKPLTRAIEDGDNIYAVICATSENHGGRTNSLTAPNVNAQAELLSETYSKAGIDPATVTYIEAHGTGTALGDPIEINGLKKAFAHLYEGLGREFEGAPYCGVGSVKTNIGHLEACAGIAGLLKAVLAIQHGTIPGNLHLKELNPYIELENSPFYIVRDTKPWERLTDENGNELPYRTGVSSFGFGGVNAHVVLEEYQNSPVKTDHSQGEYLITLSAKTDESLKNYAGKLLKFLKEKYDESRVHMSNLAYTFQTGREEFEERLALIVNSNADLQEKLNDFCLGREHIPGLFRNNSNGDKGDLAILLEGAEGIHYLDRIIEEKKLAKLARLWVNGVKINWDSLYDIKPGRVSLPTYPFLKTEYRIETDFPETGLLKEQVRPLVDHIYPALSGDILLCFKKVFTGNEKIIRDHEVNGAEILPGVGYLEMVYEAVSWFRKGRFSFSKVVWLNPLAIEHPAKEVFIILKQEAADIVYEVRSEGVSGTLHSKGQINFWPDEPVSKEERLFSERVKERCQHTLVSEDFYRSIREFGINYKGYFQGVHTVWFNDDEAISLLRLPAKTMKELNLYTLHPTIMDGALQTMAVLTDTKAALKIPFAVDKLEILRPLTGECYAYVRKNGENSFHIAVCDMDGNVCVKFINLVLRKAKDLKEDMCYYPQWEKVAFDLKPAVGLDSSQATVFIIPKEGTGLEESFKKNSSGLFTIRLGNETKQYSEDEMEVDVSDPAALEKCIAGIQNIGYIYYLGGICSSIVDTDVLQQIEAGAEYGVISLFRLCKALVKSGYKKAPLRLTVVTNNAIKLTGEEAFTTYTSPVIGFSMAASQEYPAWSIRSLDVSFETDSAAEITSSLISLCQSDFEVPGFLVLRGREIYHRVIRKLKFSQPHANGFKPKGVYFIVGGSGGIGFSLCKYLAQKVQAGLVLIGRSALDEKLALKVAELEKEGSEVLYIQADTADFYAMKTAMAKAIAHFGKIDGVIHSALVLKDKMIENMTEEELKEVLSPKVMGSAVLYDVFQDIPLDFMLFFASANSFLKSAGQANYSAGCVFQDLFALAVGSTAPYPVKTINWSYWSEVGIVASREYSEKLTAFGMKGIKTKDGLDIIEKVIANPAEQVVVIKANKNILAGIGYQDSGNVVAFPYAVRSFGSIDNMYLPSLEEEKNLVKIIAGFKEIEKYGVFLLREAFGKLGFFSGENGECKRQSLRERLGIIDEYHRLYDALLAIMERFEYIKSDNQRIIPSPGVFNGEELKQVKEGIAANYPSLLPYATLLEVCLGSYPEVLTGKKDHMAVMFPGGSKELVEPIYKGNGLVDYYNKVIALIVRKYIDAYLEKEKDGTINLLEIGAGTGGTSVFVFEQLRDIYQKVKYYYTDISIGFTQFGEQQYGNRYGHGIFKTFDIDKDIEAQGFLPNSIDIVFASNVIHATADIPRTLMNVKQLLREDGLFILNEITSFQVFSTLCFGLTRGWWLFEDAQNRIPYSPLLNVGMWKKQLHMNGFININPVDALRRQTVEREQSIIISQSNGLVLEKTNQTAPVNTQVPEKALKQAAETFTNKVNSLPEPVKAKKKPMETVLPQDLRRQTLDFLKNLFAQTLKIDSSTIKNDVVFEKYGIDSMIIIELNKNFEAVFRQVPSTILFEHTTLDSLTDYFINHYSGQLEEKFGTKNRMKVETHSFTDETEANSLDELGNISFEAASPATPVAKRTPVQMNQDIAIIGITGRYPLADNVEDFWENLQCGKNCITEIPQDRWDWRKYFDPSGNESGTSYSKWGGFIRDVDAFDADFFEISDGMAGEMDPQERIALEMTWRLLEDAGYPFRSLAKKGYRTGVYIGVMYGTYGILGALASSAGNYTNAQSSYWLIANRVSHYFDFNGPSLAVDSACSSSLTSIHLACESIKRGECDAAVAGGINLILHPRHFSRLSGLKNLSSSDQTKSFGANGDGFVVGEGAGFVLLKSLDKAIQDKDRIYGIIKGSFINSTGNAGAFMSPNPASQGTLIEEAIKRSDIDPRTINYIEAHGTGTSLGDPVEIRGLTKAFRKYTEEKQFCAIGSVKSNIGHLEAAAGISALTKVLMQIKHKKLAPSLHVEEMNSYINFKDSPFYIQKDLSDWEAMVFDGQALPRRAGISSFGAGGSNAHLIVEEYVNPNQVIDPNNDEPRLMVLSAKNKERLKDYATKLGSFIESHGELKLADIAYTLQSARHAMEERLAFVAASVQEARMIFQQYAVEDKVAKMFSGAVSDETTNSNAVAAAIRLNDLAGLAKLWVSGENIDWRALYHDVLPAIVTLTEYPFERKRHWLPARLEKDEVRSLRIIASERYSYRYNEPYLRDHVTFGEQVLLGVTHLSLAVQSARLAFKDRSGLRIRNFLLIEPVIVRRDETVDIEILIHEENDKFMFISRFKNGGANVYKEAARGEFYFSDDKVTSAVNLQSFMDSYEKKYLTEDVYTRKKPGVYGSSLMTVKEVYQKGDEVVGLLELTEEIAGDGHVYYLHPAVLDGAMVSRFALLEDSNEPEPFIPLMIKRAYILANTPRNCYCHVKQLKSNDEMWEIDLTLYKPDGELFAGLQGFVSKRVRINAPAAAIFEERGQDDQAAMAIINPGDNLTVKIRKYIAGKLMAILNVPSNTIKLDKNFMDMGVNSLNLVNLTREIAGDIGTDLYPTLFFEHQCLKDLADFFSEEYAGQFLKLFNREVSGNIPYTGKTTVNPNAGFADNLQREYRQALAAINPYQTPQGYHPKEKMSAADEPIAIIGLSGVMPQSEDLEDFWVKLVGCQSLVTEIPKDRWDWQKYYPTSSVDTSKTKVIWGGFMKEIDKFDPGFFGISPREAALMDPQHRISLELAWKAVEDAGYNPKELSGTKTGVFIGVAGHDYSDILAQGIVDSESQALTGNAHNLLTGRISYLLNLHGPSEPFDNACASSLVAIHRAVECLRNGDCELALAGGINVITSPSLFISFDNVGILSPDGKCKTFDKDANGTVRGEGAGIILLKPLSKAIQDNDHIYAVIRGIAVNHGGHGNSLTAPNLKQQAEVIVNAYERAGLDPETVSYIETHGTATSLGDPIEVNGLKTAYKQLYHKWGKEFRAGNRCGLGAVKTNIGHLETAAGIAGVIKVLLCMKHGVLPGIVNFTELNPYIQLDDCPFYIIEDSQKWDRRKDSEGKELLYRAGVSAFGFSGVNAHILLEEYLNPEPVELNQKKALIILSARNEERLLAYAGALRDFLVKNAVKPRVSVAKSDFAHAGLKKDVLSIIASIISIDAKDLDEDISLVEYGFDYPKMVEFTDALNGSYGLDLGLAALSMESRLKDIIRILGEYDKVGRYYQEDSEAAPSQEKDFSSISLDRIAYTLQKSRNAMEERLALVVSSCEELLQKLQRIITGDKNIDNFYRGNTRNRIIDEDSIAAEETAAVIAPEIELEKLARMWTSGVEIKNWETLYPAGAPQKISLPAYPFARKRHWITIKGQTGGGTARASSLTALIDSNESTLEYQCYKKTLNQEEFYLRDHVINGTMILPGVVYLEMARMAGSLAYQQQEVTGLKNVVWIKPVEVANGQTEVFTNLYPEEETVSYTITTGDGAICSQGSLIYGRLQGTTPEQVDIEAIKHRCTQSMIHDQFYQMFHKSGFEYGHSFMPIGVIHFNDREALSRIEIPADLRISFDSFLLHPVLMEGGLQTAGYLINRELRSTTPYIPFAFGALEIYGKLTPSCYAYTAFSSGSENLPAKKLDVTLMDESGQVLARIKEYLVKPLSKDNKAETVFFGSVWKESGIQAGSKPNQGPALVFDRDGMVSAELSTGGLEPVVLIQPGNAFKCVGANRFEIKPDQESDYRELFAYLKNNGVEYREVVHLWSFDILDYPVEKEQIEAQLGYSIYSLFYLIRTMIAPEFNRPTNLRYFYKEDEPLFEGIGGFLKSIRLENKNIKCETIGVDQKDSGLAAIIRNEITGGVTGAEIRYVNGLRKVKIMEPQTLIPGSGSAFKEEGVYLITGGMGGIGFMIAHSLADKYKPCLVLTGRTLINETIKGKLASLESKGARAIYVSGDISEKNHVERTIAETKRLFGKIDGVIHCAGLIHDALISNKKPEEVREVILPKVHGTINIDMATQYEELDFVALFSSISGEIGNIGQCDYAYANNFMDYFAEYREKLRKQGKRQGRTIAINWPLWKEGGIRLSPEAEKFMNNTLHLSPLENGQGMNIFEQCLASGREQVLVLYGDPGKMDRLFASEKPREAEKENVSLDIDESEMLRQLIHDLVKAVAKISSMDEQEITVTTELEQYGFDSIIMTEFANKINKKLGLSITPALFFELTELTLNKLGKHLMGRCKEELIRHYHISTGEQAQPAPKEEKRTLDLETHHAISLKSRFKPGINQAPISGMPVTGGLTYEPIAIIGIGGVMPQSEDMEEFWKHLVQCADLITEVPADRWDWRDFYGDPLKEGNKTLCKWGGFMKEVDKFDALFFNISPQEARLLDPQQRIFLETAWKTIEDAGYKPSALSGTDTGVFVGVTNTEYTGLLSEAKLKVDGHSVTSNAHFLIANRTSYFFNFRGPSETVDAACSSSGVAIHRAVTSLHNGECSMALVGGVNVLVSPQSNLAFDSAGMLSRDGKCKTFDKNADGFVRSEGIGVLLLKPFQKAVADQDRIYAVIRGSAVNHSGRSKSFTAPNPNGQVEVIKSAIRKSGVDPLSISYIEAHGTASALGDNVEVEAIKKAFSDIQTEGDVVNVTGPVCGLGSVKTNIGHLEAASGIASVLKVVMSLKHKALPASINCVELNPYLNLQDSLFYIVREKTEWRRLMDRNGVEIPRRAGINIFGAGGVNAHIILEEYETKTSQAELTMETPVIIVFSAKNKASLTENIAKTARFISENQPINLRDVAYTLQLARDEMDERVAMVVRDIEDFLDKCACLEKNREYGGSEDIDIFEGNIKADNQEIRELLSDDGLGETLIRSALETKKYSKLAKLWVKGIPVEWRKLYENEARTRISLPTYCFNRQRYWIKSEEDQLGKGEDRNDMSHIVKEAELGNPGNDMRHLAEEDSGPCSLKEMITGYFQDKIGVMLGLSPGMIEVDAQLSEIGFDSITAAKLKYEIENELMTSIPLAVIGESKSIESMADKILESPELTSVRDNISLNNYRQGDPARVQSHRPSINADISQMSVEEMDNLFDSLKDGIANKA